MPSKKRKILTHEQIWDDTALIESWDEALQEYKYYHSIRARGEKVRDVLADAESSHGVNGDATEADEQDNGQPKCVASGPRSVGSEEGEIEEQPVPADLPPTSSQVDWNQTQSLPHTEQQAYGLLPGGHPLLGEAAPQPPAVVSGVQDEGLKNLMMSWYYAGYYTGLHEGRRQGKLDEPKG